MADIEGLAEPLRSIVKKIVEESGGKVTVSSGRRTNAEQRALYQKYLSGNGNLAAKPGHSAHESGYAVDFGGDLNLAAQLAEKYGLRNSVPGEPWHFTLGNGDESTQYDLGPATENGANPQDVLADRLHSILRIIGLDATSGSVGTTSPSFGDPDADEVFMPGNNSPFAPPTSTGEAAFESKGQYQKYAEKKLADYGMSRAEMDALIELWNRESGWDPTAQNPTSTAFGIAQFLNGTWAGTGIAKTTDPFQQIDAGLAYIKGRYGSPNKALEFHNRNNWY